MRGELAGDAGVGLWCVSRRMVDGESAETGSQEYQLRWSLSMGKSNELENTGAVVSLYPDNRQQRDV